jgi:thiamine biosynthesis protein ThiC
MTQVHAAHKGTITPEMVRVAIRENLMPVRFRDLAVHGRLARTEALHHEGRSLLR